MNKYLTNTFNYGLVKKNLISDRLFSLTPAHTHGHLLEENFLFVNLPRLNLIKKRAVERDSENDENFPRKLTSKPWLNLKNRIDIGIVKC